MSINSISPIDGRYEIKTKSLSKFFSEKALIKYRVKIEILYLKMLINSKIIDRKLNDEEILFLDKIIEISDEEVNIIKLIESTGYEDILATNHDVKAIEYYIKYKFKDTNLKDIKELIHFSLTSEDINNISYSLMVRDGFNQVLFPTVIEIYDILYNMSVKNKNVSMLARTHGQPATPTTFGKEILVFISRIKEELKFIYNIILFAKLNGATGNYNSHCIVFDNIEWIKFSEEFINLVNGKNNKIESKYFKSYPLKIMINHITTQIEPHDSLARLFDSIKRINTILLDFCNDIWRYISDGWLKQKTIQGEIGSSAMPHKVNPIDFENAEGNLGIANSLFVFFSNKLLISRLQRDLSDSTVLRNIGVAFAHSLLAYKSIIKGLSKIEIDKNKMLSSLKDNPEVISEAYQNILRIEGIEKPYELLKEITRGKKVKLDDFYDFVKTLKIKDSTKERLLSITPENYIGLSAKLVDDFDPIIIK